MAEISTFVSRQNLNEKSLKGKSLERRLLLCLTASSNVLQRYCGRLGLKKMVDACCTFCSGVKVSSLLLVSPSK